MDPTGDLLLETPVDGGLTTGAVARLLGVAPTTLRSWDRRYGIGPAAREDGRHRRWTGADIAALRHMCALTSAGLPPAEAARTVLAGTSCVGTSSTGPSRAEESGAGASGAPAAPRSARASRAPGPLPVGRARQECRGLARAAVRLDAPALDELLTAVLDRYGLPAAWDEVIMPVLHAVGRKWETAGERYIEVEHLLSWHVSGALRGVTAGRTPTPGAGLALLACAPGETHTLALEALAATLAQQGLPVRMFGAAVPAGALEDAIRRTGPAAVVLWAQSRKTASPALVARLDALEWGVRGARRRPVVCVAGPGWAGRQAPGARHLSGLSDAVDTLATL
ncbi:MerR family transcriptional regulator [Streptomyces sp. MBT67]|uniref:MerR family transcriptional regulator n=1 Tax=unclassified Streptomyces TaxID=2593676 RepID=UPI00190CDC5B|nr:MULTISPECIES: MerR family transcriptional regulator [unclassified Streptomyces]MBK3531434.1 MerR family transcriptional regulator [Streptomyces sp. MBT72]MBK3539060.1 MerR family transcriptional regulator [Streptomyces sp. MBT67]MBK3552564.1 MerR family transcriptional regulator [Streptomyces sp. MBT61]MBK6031826.1 MerR family transcriptional regulator [Streptomyces sp. MBT59]